MAIHASACAEENVNRRVSLRRDELQASLARSEVLWQSEPYLWSELQRDVCSIGSACCANAQVIDR